MDREGQIQRIKHYIETRIVRSVDDQRINIYLPIYLLKHSDFVTYRQTQQHKVYVTTSPYTHSFKIFPNLFFKSLKFVIYIGERE